ncbi:MAG: dienelactone hydrolase family protein [Nitrosomonadales bacterium]|nr:dienelactone hydrolase family protein [Nitrosomonadales bacterium]
MKKLLLAFSLMCFCGVGQAAVQGKEVSYEAEGTTLVGYLAYDDAIKGKRPAVIVVHEWWGNNEYSRKRARMLAELGYTALAVDMYGNGKVANIPAEAVKLASDLNRNVPLQLVRFKATMKFLSEQETVDPDKVAAFGYGFGGSVVLNMARLGVRLVGVANFHGGLVTDYPARRRGIWGRVISFVGENDPAIDPGSIWGFKAEMAKAQANYQLVVYPGVKNGFTNPDSDALGKKFDLPLGYDAVADKDSWHQATEMLRDVFAPK